MLPLVFLMQLYLLHPARVKVCSRKGPHHTQCLPSLYLHSISSLVSYPEQAMELQTGTGFQLHIFVYQDAPVCVQTRRKSPRMYCYLKESTKACPMTLSLDTFLLSTGLRFS